MIFPNARIIHCKRDPMDNAYSIYKNNFGTNTGLKYAYDMEELGKYYHHCLKLRDHWNKVLPNFIFEIQYENLVSDQKAETKRLLKFCNLAWDD